MGLHWLSAGVALLALILGIAVTWKSPRHPTHLAFGIGMALLGLETYLSAMALRELRFGELSWERARLLTSTILPFPWLVFSRCFSRGDALEAFARFRRWTIAGLIAALGFIFATRDGLVLPPVNPLLGSPVPRLGWPGVIVEVWVLLACVGILTNLERTFRGSVGIMRWRVKYMVLGVGAMFGFRLFAASQAILYRTPEGPVGHSGAAALLVGCILIGVALTRGSVFDVDVYPSQTLVFGSLTVLLAGAYLLIVGILSHLVARLGGASGFPFQAFLILIGLVGLAVLLLSERLRQRLRTFVSRHLRRPVYDYRRVWSTFTAKTTSLVDEAAFCRAVANWSSETFQALSASVWIVPDSGDRLRLGGSTALVEGPATADASSAEVRDAIAALSAIHEPTPIDSSRHAWAATLRKLQPEVFGDAGSGVCQPLSAGGRLVGLLVLGDRVRGVPFTTEDFDLLRTVGDQLAASLLGLQLSAQLLRAKEFEAFQAMSTFFVHDLKNTASTLSLTLQNLHQHFSDPAFRDDALRAVGKSVQHLKDLIARLSRLREGLRVNPAPGSLADVAEAAIAALGPSPTARIQRQLGRVPPVLIDADQLQKVVLNLLLNAQEASSGNGAAEIRLATESRPGWAVLSVTDQGCGMSPEFVTRSLFRPFQTTKKNGLGIGMFHSKMIVEAHRGRMEVDTAPGQGTTVRVHLPLETQPT